MGRAVATGLTGKTGLGIGSECQAQGRPGQGGQWGTLGDRCSRHMQGKLGTRSTSHGGLVDREGSGPSWEV